MKNFGAIFFFLGLMACQTQPTTPIAEVDKDKLMARGDSIASLAQKNLLLQVSNAIETLGVDSAVAFCNHRAIPITDSLSQSLHAPIARLSLKARNPNNVLKNNLDSMAWEQLTTLYASQKNPTPHILLANGNEQLYYKAIPLGMPTCLQCHGNIDSDIQPSTQAIIATKYPNDQATNYALGDLRGMWKIHLK